MFSRTFFKTFTRLLRPHTLLKRGTNIFILSSLITGYFGISHSKDYFNKSISCLNGQNQNDFKKLIASSEHKVVVIYRKDTNKPIATGLVLDKSGLFLTINNIFVHQLQILNNQNSINDQSPQQQQQKQSKQQKQFQQQQQLDLNDYFYVKLLSNDDTEFSLKIEYQMTDENLCFCRAYSSDQPTSTQSFLASLQALSPSSSSQQQQAQQQQQQQILDKVKFEPTKLNSNPEKGDSIFLVGKNELNLSVIKTGFITDPKIRIEDLFNDNIEARSFVMASSLRNTGSTSLFGAPLFDEKGNVFGILMPFNPKLVKTQEGHYFNEHSFTIPASHLEGIIQQYLQKKIVKRPYLGMSVKTAESSPGGGAFIIRVNTEGPAQQAGLQLGEVIKEVNMQKIRTADELIKVIGYGVGKQFKIIVDKDGKRRETQFTTQQQ